MTLPIFDPEDPTVVALWNATLGNVHPAEKCSGQWCVIHNPSDHCMAKNGGPIVDIRNGRQVILSLDHFINKAAGPANTPLIKVGPNVGDNQVKVGPLVNIDYDGRVLSSRASQVVKIDPSLRYEIG